MKYLAAVLFLLATTAFAQPPQRVVDLRQVLQQYDAAGAPQPPRQLTADERAQLRKQLAEFTPPPASPRKKK